ncbi:MAG: peptide chain release factor-like protein [Candidatus Omnitrophica bacterium]|nr:peptide chain release factor-like protein [Candidatus Omnitrophota bacterium]
MANISKPKQEALLEKMHELKVYEKDIIEKFIRPQGKGGQKVNKTSSCVYLKHKPSGIEVKCQRERSQVLNRFLARRILVNKIETLIKGEASTEQKRIEKIRRQKRKRSKRAKEKMLRDKAKRSQKKEHRSHRPLAEESGE